MNCRFEQIQSHALHPPGREEGNLQSLKLFETVGKKVSDFFLILIERVFQVQQVNCLVSKEEQWWLVKSLDDGGQAQECKEPMVYHRSTLILHYSFWFGRTNRLFWRP